MTSHFCKLPQELQIQILANLDAVSLTRCAMTCTSIYDTLKGSSSLAYTLQLHLDGLKDAGTGLKHPDLIEALMRRRRAWLALEKTGPLTLRTQPDCDTCVIAAGAFGTASMQSDQFEIVGLPTAIDAIERTLRRPVNGISVEQSAMDPTQDLVVFLEDDASAPMDTLIYRIHIRAISTNAVHPQAQQSPLHMTVGSRSDYANIVFSTVLQIAYGIVAIQFRNVEGETRALVWDWMTSDLLLDTSTSFDPCLPSLTYDFGLLDSTYFFIATEGISGAIRLYKLVQSHAEAAQATHLATLHLPPTSPGITIDEIVSHAGPIEANPLPHTPFMVHDDDRLHMLAVKYRRATPDGPRTHDVHLFLHQRVLHTYARRASADEHAPLDIPWAEWGPRHTRMALSSPLRYVPHWRRCVYGQRSVLTQDGSSITVVPPYAVDVFDFSLAAVLSAQGIPDAPSTATEQGHPGRLLPSSTIRTEDVPLFLDDVETHLPCVQSTLDLKVTWGAYMLYADGIIAVNVRPPPFFAWEYLFE